MEDAKKQITEKTAIVSIAHVSNVLGVINPIAELTKLAHQHQAVMVVDGAQAVPHMTVDVQALDCDFYAFLAIKCADQLALVSCTASGNGWIRWSPSNLAVK